MTVKLNYLFLLARKIKQLLSLDIILDYAGSDIIIIIIIYYILYN